MEGSSADFYEFSPSELLVLEKWFAGGKRRFIAQPHYHLDIDAKMAALKISPSIVSLISFSGDQVLSQASGTIIETQQNYNFVMTSLYLVRPRRSASKSAKNRLAHNLKVVVRASDENSYVGKIHVYDFHYNILLIKFKSKSPFPCARLRNPENSFQLHPHSLKLKPGDPIVIVGKYFYCDCEFMAASGSFSMRDGLLDDYGCGELLSVTCRSPCGISPSFLRN
ncbi:hypothetical protein RND81_01G003800 [Saponaria officinalis]|uniref:Uncharacterized protein n=1 Tax=Saponaria officinalis TaxID=3572 RepID=A0AAW1N7W6_SAPOF